MIGLLVWECLFWGGSRGATDWVPCLGVRGADGRRRGQQDQRKKEAGTQQNTAESAAKGEPKVKRGKERGMGNGRAGRAGVALASGSPKRPFGRPNSGDCPGEPPHQSPGTCCQVPPAHSQEAKEKSQKKKSPSQQLCLPLCCNSATPLCGPDCTVRPE